ncbi:MAG: hypothetical protein V3T02_10950 [Alphaproteobacteria bacterium]
MKTSRILSLTTMAAALALATMAGPAEAQSVEKFYKGKRIQMIIGLSSGGGYDRYARLLARHMGRYIPGNPRFVAKNKPGGGSLVAANFIYNAAAQDGTYIGAIQRGIPVEPLTKGKDSKALFDPLKIKWIGSTNEETSIAIAWHTAGIKSYKDLYTKQLIVGGTGVTTDSVVTAHVMRNLLGMKFKVIAGYPGGSEMDLAMERGETGGRATFSWSSFKVRRMKWAEQKKVVILYQMGLTKNNEGLLKDVPLALDFAKDALTREVLKLKFGVGVFGRPYMVGPKVPDDRFQALRKAFDQTVKDKKFLAGAKKSRLDVNPASGAKVAKVIAAMYATPPDVQAALVKASLPASKVEIVKIPITIRKGVISKVRRKGGRITYKAGKKKAKLRVSGRRTKITIGGKKAKRKALKVGMSCTFTHQASRAKKIDC